MDDDSVVDRAATVILLDDQLLAQRAEANFTKADQPGKLISMDDEREKRSPKDAFYAAIEEHAGARYRAEREQLLQQIDLLNEIVQSYQGTESDRTRAYLEALRQTETRVSELREMYETRIVELQDRLRDREDKIQEIAKILLEKSTKSQQERAIKILTGISSD